MSVLTADLLDAFTPIDLATLDRTAGLLTRKDRKYLVTEEELTALLDRVLGDDAAALEIDRRRTFEYESVYLDTPTLDAYHLAARDRPRRFKVRIRRYLDSDAVVLEVKTRGRRGETVKSRLPLAAGSPLVEFGPDEQAWLSSFPDVAPYVDRLGPVVTTRYLRSTLVFARLGARTTIDRQLTCHDAWGRSTELAGFAVVETKSTGAPSPVDRLLWEGGNRPLRISKFAYGLTRLHPELRGNRWGRALRRTTSPATSRREL